MNPLLDLTRPYPFARLRELTADIVPNPDLTPISLGIGEPRHPTPSFILKAISENFGELAKYPATAGSLELRQAISTWIQKRYHANIDAKTQVLPVLGSREALFSLAQTVVDPSAGSFVVMPNPFYQIYEGAALLAGATPVYLPLTKENRFAMDLSTLSPDVLSKTSLVYLCSPSNPCGSTMTLTDWQRAFDLSDEYGFVIAADECYSEIYFEEGRPPVGALEAATALGRTDFKRLVILQSLSKRSNVPGLRSGFVAGDAEIMKRFQLYRTYHGSAMSGIVQSASIAAWKDEVHVVENRRLYRDKFFSAQPLLASVMDAPMPDAGFYIWAKTPVSDTEFTRGLLASKNLTVLPGSFLGREIEGINPGAGHIRLALVATPSEVEEAVGRLVDYVREG